jgi:hypothetical protein
VVDLEHQGEDLHQEGEAVSPLEAGVLLEVEVVISTNNLLLERFGSPRRCKKSRDAPYK